MIHKLFHVTDERNFLYRVYVISKAGFDECFYSMRQEKEIIFQRVYHYSEVF